MNQWRTFFYFKKIILAIGHSEWLVTLNLKSISSLGTNAITPTFYMVRLSIVLVVTKSSFSELLWDCTMHKKKNYTLKGYGQCLSWLGLPSNPPVELQERATLAVCPLLFLQRRPVGVEGKYESNIWMHDSGPSAETGLHWPAHFLQANHQGHHLLHRFSSFLTSLFDFSFQQ